MADAPWIWREFLGGLSTGEGVTGVDFQVIDRTYLRIVLTYVCHDTPKPRRRPKTSA